MEGLVETTVHMCIDMSSFSFSFPRPAPSPHSMTVAVKRLRHQEEGSSEGLDIDLIVEEILIIGRSK